MSTKHEMMLTLEEAQATYRGLNKNQVEKLRDAARESIEIRDIERGVYVSDLNEHAVTREAVYLIQINGEMLDSESMQDIYDNWYEINGDYADEIQAARNADNPYETR